MGAMYLTITSIHALSLEYARKLYLVGHRLGAGHVADEQAGQQRADRHQQRIRDEIHKVENGVAHNADIGQHPVAQGGQNADEAVPAPTMQTESFRLIF